VAACCAVVGLGAAPAVASAAAGLPAWGPGTTTPLPSGAVASGSQIAQLIAVACGSPGNCVAVGYYLGADGYEPVVAPVTDGVLGAAVEVTLPAGALTSGQHAELNAVSCPSTTLCVAVGEYEGASNAAAPLVVSLTNGVPAQGTTSTLPSGALTNYNQQAYLGAIACPTTSFCQATGDFQTAAGTEALTVAIANGSADGASAPVLPGGALTSNQDAYFNGVSCASATSCLAVGSFTNADGREGLVTPLTDSTPGTSTASSLPNLALTTGQGASLNAVSCSSADVCVAAGAYTDSLGGEPFVVTVTGGTPGAAYESALPPGARNTHDGEFDAISCAPAGTCLAVGDYEDSVVGLSPLAVPVSGGVPGTPVTVPVPSGTTTYGGDFDTVSCVATATCVASGDYFASSGGTEGVILPVTDGSAGTPLVVTLPSGASVRPNVELIGSTCPSLGTCLTVGDFGTTADGDQLLSVASQPQLSISTTTLPSATVDQPYSTTLAAAGGVAPFTWSLSGGELPAGLELNSQTGVISGTPQSAGSQSFTVTVAGTGSPAQTASEPLSFSVSVVPMPVPVPVIKLKTRSAVVVSGRVALSLSCAGAPCAGSVKLERSELVTVRHGHKTQRRRETVVVATVGYRLASGQSAAVKLRLRPRARADLAKAKSGELKVVAVVSLTGGHTVRDRIELHRKRATRATLEVRTDFVLR
jgi:hypothetical protein